jgi:DNA mismatch endonuclease (patch repair protein)
MASRRKPYRPKPRDEVHRNMAAIRSQRNKTEEYLAKLLYARGLRHQRYSARLPGRPDLVFRQAKLAVFVDGDYWHGRLLIDSGPNALRRYVRRLPRSAQQYWIQKLTKRVERDRNITNCLRRAGWSVLRYWESDVKRQPDMVAAEIERRVRLRARRASPGDTRYLAGRAK